MHRLLSAFALLAAGCACERGIGLSGTSNTDVELDDIVDSDLLLDGVDADLIDCTLDIEEENDGLVCSCSPECAPEVDGTTCLEICSGCDQSCIYNDCTLICDGGACTQNCTPFENCSQTCFGGGCTQTCMSGDCSLQCNSGACDQVCTNSDTCLQQCPGGEGTGNECTQRCDDTINCNLGCPGGGCEQHCSGIVCVSDCNWGCDITCDADYCYLYMGVGSGSLIQCGEDSLCELDCGSGGCIMDCAGACKANCTYSPCIVTCSDGSAATVCPDYYWVVCNTDCPSG